MRARKYFIADGVRRALACREAGRTTVPARLVVEGRKDIIYPRLRLDCLYVEKARKGTVESDDRYNAIDPPIKVPIQVQPIGVRNQPTVLLPLLDVELV